jgi:hypothetical protein
LRHHTDIQQHADGDKEQTQQHIAEGFDVFLDLIAVFGFRNQHARDKRTQREGKPGKLGQPRNAEGDQQHIQYKEFG